MTRKPRTRIALVVRIALTATIAAGVGGVCLLPSARAQTVKGETELTGAARAAAKREVDALTAEGKKIHAAKGKRAAYDALLTKDFVFDFAPVGKTETVAREHFLSQIHDKPDDSADSFGMSNSKGDKSVRPDRYVSRKGGSEIVLYMYPLLTSVEAATPSGTPAPDATGGTPPPSTANPAPAAKTTTVTTFAANEVFVHTPQGLRMKSMGFSNLVIKVNGEAVPSEMLAGLTFDEFSKADDKDDKPATPATSH